MKDAYIVDAVRSPVGKRRGGLSAVHPADLGAHAIRALVERTAIDPTGVDDVIFGCGDTIGAQAGDIARTCGLVAGLPETVPGVTIDRQCGSSQQAVHFAAQGVMSGTADVIIAGGVQSMSRYPLTSSFSIGEDLDPFSGSPGWKDRYGTQEISQFRAAEMIAQKWKIDRDEMEDFALRSHKRALAAQSDHRFDDEIAELAGVWADECPRPDTSLAAMAELPTLVPDGRLTAATSSQYGDASAAVLIVSETGIDRHGLRPRARIHHLSVLGEDPVIMLTAPIPATGRALERAGLGIDDIDAFEVNEAFASVVIAWLKETGGDPDRVNVNGGAIALGHPIGATGARLMTSLLGQLERTNGRYGLQTMCEGGGQANVTIIERL